MRAATLKRLYYNVKWLGLMRKYQGDTQTLRVRVDDACYLLPDLPIQYTTVEYLGHILDWLPKDYKRLQYNLYFVNHCVIHVIIVNILLL